MDDLTSDENNETENIISSNFNSESDPECDLLKTIKNKDEENRSKDHIKFQSLSDQSLGALHKVDEIHRDKSGDIAVTATCAATVEGPLPRPPTPKRLLFGCKVEKVRRDIISRRQMCKSKAEFESLFHQIDNWIIQAKQIGQETIAIRLLLDKSVVAHFGLDFDKALELSASALDETYKLKSQDEAFQLQLVGKFVQCSVYSRQNKLGRAWGMLQEIKNQIKESENSEDHWRLHYNMGTNYLARLKTCNIKNDRVVLPGVEQFKKCRDAISDGESKGQTYDMQDHFFALVMSAKLLLDLPEHKTKREDTKVTHDNIMNAQSLLQVICTDYPFVKMVHRFKLRLFITFAGLYYRRGQRNAKDENDTSARRDFTDAIIFLECASLLSADSPYEEKGIITEFIEYLRQKNQHIFLHNHFSPMTGTYGLDQYKSRESDHELEAPESEGFTSDDFGNPVHSTNKTRKRRTRTVRHAQSIDGYFSSSPLTSSTTLSSVSLDSEVSTAKPFLTTETDILIKIEIEHLSRKFSSDSSTNSSSGTNLENSFGSTSSTASNFRGQRDSQPCTYPVFSPPEPISNYVSSATDSSLGQRQDTVSSDKEETNILNPEKVGRYLIPKKTVELHYHYLAKNSIRESVFGEKVLDKYFSSSKKHREGIMFEISYVQQYVSTNRSWNHSPENTCIPLLISAKVALDFPESCVGMKRFVVTMGDLKAAYNAIHVIKQTLPLDTTLPLKAEVSLIMASYYFRASQIAAKYKLLSTCKLSLNMGVLYAEFAETFALAQSNLTDRAKTITNFKNALENIAKRFFDKLDTNVLVVVS